MQSNMFSQTSEDLPLFSGQDYGPEDKGSFKPVEQWTQDSLLDVGPQFTSVPKSCGVSKEEIDWYDEEQRIETITRDLAPPRTKTLGQAEGDARQAELARMRELRGRRQFVKDNPQYADTHNPCND